MKGRIATVMFGLYLLSASALAKSTGQNFQFYVTDNRSGEGIHAATVEVNGTTVCITTNGSCSKVLEYANGDKVKVKVTADSYPPKTINLTLSTTEVNYIGLDRPPSKGRRPTAMPLGIVFAEGFVASAPVQDPDGREILISFTVIVQDVANARIPHAKVTVTDERGVTRSLTTDDRNGSCQFSNLKKGRMRISVVANGFADGSAARSVVNNQQVAITLRVSER